MHMYHKLVSVFKEHVISQAINPFVSSSHASIRLLRQLRAWAPNQKKQQRFSVQKRILKLWNFNSGSSTLLSSSIHWIGRILGREENAKVIAADGRKLFYQNPTATRSFHCRTCDYTKLQEYTGYEQQNAKHAHTQCKQVNESILLRTRSVGPPQHSPSHLKLETPKNFVVTAANFLQICTGLQ